MSRTSGIVSSAFIALFTAAAASAQTDSQRIANVLRSNQHVVVVDLEGREFNGRVKGASQDTLALLVAGQLVDVRVEDIVRIDHPRDGLGNGAWIGFGVMAGMTAVSFALNPGCDAIPDCWRPSFPVTVWAVGVTGAMGAGIGAAIDAMIGGDRPVIYRRGWPRASIAPAIGPGVRGGVVSVTW
jgi:hypothetical protein